MKGKRELGDKADHALSYEGAEQFAWFLRQWLVPGDDVLLRLPGLPLFERLHEFTVPTLSDEDLPILWDVCPELPTGEAQTFYRPAKDGQPARMVIELTADTYARLEQEEGRARFDLFHELTHATAHARLLRRFSAVQQGSLQRRVLDLARLTANHPIYLDVEWQADAVSGAALMPAEGIASIVDQTPAHLRSERYLSRRIAEHFGASIEAAELRLGVFLDRRDSLIAASRAVRAPP